LPVACSSVSRRRRRPPTSSTPRPEALRSKSSPASRRPPRRPTGRPWGGSDHTFSGNAANLSIDATPGGCWCEKLANGGGVRHLTVVYADPGKLIRFSGGLGPLQDMAVNGAMQWTFKEAAGQTTIEVTYKVGGYAPGGLEPLSKAVDGVLASQVLRLKALIDGSPLG
jgi:hypothetical protein